MSQIWISITTTTERSIQHSKPFESQDVETESSRIEDFTQVFNGNPAGSLVEHSAPCLPVTGLSVKGHRF